MGDIFFKSAQHKERFVTTMQRLRKIYDGKFDPEYAAAIYILTADLSTAEKSSEYMSCHGIDIDAMLEDVDFSGGHSVLIELAGNLFNGQRQVDPLEFLRLDRCNFSVAITSLMIRRNGYRVEKTPEILFCSQCHKPIDSLYTHTENNVKKNYCSYCYIAQFD